MCFFRLVMAYVYDYKSRSLMLAFIKTHMVSLKEDIISTELDKCVEAAIGKV